jgi:hypothetical protein
VRIDYCRYDILNAVGEARVGYVIYDGKQWNIYSGLAGGRIGYIDGRGGRRLDSDISLFVDMNSRSDWIKQETTPVS